LIRLGFKGAVKHFPAHKTIRVFFSFIPITFLICTPFLNASEQNKMNIAISDFAGKNVSAADASIVADFMRTELVKSGKYNVVDKSNMDKILAEASFQQSGCTESDCAVQLGKILNVKKIIVGTLSKLEGIYYITTNFVDVQTGKIEGSETAKCKAADELMNTSYDLADTYSGREYSNSTASEEQQKTGTRRHSNLLKRFYLGIGNPYASLGFDMTPKYSAELRYAADLSSNDNQVKIYNLRLFYNSSQNKLSWYACLEGGLISFSGYNTAGDRTGNGGYLVSTVVGTRIGITKRIRLNIDIGPSYINLVNGTVSGIEWIVNTGLDFYIF